MGFVFVWSFQKMLKRKGKKQGRREGKKKKLQSKGSVVGKRFFLLPSFRVNRIINKRLYGVHQAKK